MCGERLLLLIVLLLLVLLLLLLQSHCVSVCVCVDLLLLFSAVLYFAVASTSVWFHAKLCLLIFIYSCYKCVHIYIESAHTLANCNKSMSVAQICSENFGPLSFSLSARMCLCLRLCVNIFFLPPSRSNFVHFDKCAFHSSRTLPLFECTGASVRVSMQAHGCVGVQICYNLFRWLVVGFIRFPYVSSGDGEKIYCSHRFFRGKTSRDRDDRERYVANESTWLHSSFSYFIRESNDQRTSTCEHRENKSNGQR